MHTEEYIKLTAISKETGKLELSGELTVKNAHEIRESLLKALQSFKQIEILIEQVEALDITLFQALEAARLSSLKLKKELTFIYKLSDEAQELVRKAGLI